MKTKLSTKRIILLIGFFLNFILFSCDREYEPDLNSEHTISVNIRGTFPVIPSGEKLDGIPVEVDFLTGGYASPYLRRRVASGKTKDGEFNFNVKIDTTLFRQGTGWWLNVSYTIPENYTPPSIYGEEIRFYRYDEEALKNIRFELYKKATLTINLNRLETDVFRRVRVLSTSVDERIGISDGAFGFFNYGEVPQTVHHGVIAGIYTKVRMWKYFEDGGEELIYIDSLICKPNTDNVININY